MLGICERRVYASGFCSLSRLRGIDFQENRTVASSDSRILASIQIEHTRTGNGEVQAIHPASRKQRHFISAHSVALDAQE